MAEDRKALLERYPDGWVRSMGLVITLAAEDEVRCEWEIDERHRQGYGIVHGGVYCGVIETLASIGAHLYAISAISPEARTVGLENHTSFVRAVRSGRLTGLARPVHRGRTTQIWEGSIADSEGKPVARGTVRLLCLLDEGPLGVRDR